MLPYIERGQLLIKYFFTKLETSYEGSNELSLFHQLLKNPAQLSLPETVELQKMS